MIGRTLTLNRTLALTLSRTGHPKGKYRCLRLLMVLLELLELLLQVLEFAVRRTTIARFVQIVLGRTTYDKGVRRQRNSEKEERERRAKDKNKGNFEENQKESIKEYQQRKSPGRLRLEHRPGLGQSL